MTNAGPNTTTMSMLPRKKNTATEKNRDRKKNTATERGKIVAVQRAEYLFVVRLHGLILVENEICQRDYGTKTPTTATTAMHRNWRIFFFRFASIRLLRYQQSDD